MQYLWYCVFTKQTQKFYICTNPELKQTVCRKLLPEKGDFWFGLSAKGGREPYNRNFEGAGNRAWRFREAVTEKREEGESGKSAEM